MGRVAIFIVQIAWMAVLGGLACAFFIDRTLIPLAGARERFGPAGPWA